MPSIAVTHVVHSIAPRHGGPSVTVPALCEALGRQGHAVCLRVVDDARGGTGEAPRATLITAKLEAHPASLPLGRFAPSRSLLRALRRDAAAGHLIHSHGLWLPTNLGAHLANRGGRHVISPRGMLEGYALQHKAPLKRATFALWQRRALEAACFVHATAESERQSIRAQGLRVPIVVIPNGVEVPARQATFRAPRRTLLFLGRMVHKKGLDLLLHAWAQVAARHPDWDLVIAGPSTPRLRRELEQLERVLQAPRVRWLDEAYGEAKAALYLGASLFVLPTRSENFGVTVAEALAHGIPALCTQGAPWQALEREGCGRWVAADAAALAGGLDALLPLSRERLAAMGHKGRSYVERELSWESQALRMSQAYAWALGLASAPPWLDART